MATDPSSIIQGMLQSAGLGRTVSDFQQQDAQTQGMNLRNQAAQMQMSQEQAQAQRMQAFQTALTGFGTDPSDGNLARIALQFPEQVDTLKKQKQILDAPVLNSHKTYFSGLERVAGAGNKKLATQQLQSMITAEKAQGHDTSEAEDMLSAIGAGEPDALKRVQAFAKGQLYVIDPEYAAAIDKAQGEGAKHFASTGDSTIYDERTGEVVRQAASKVEYKTIKNADGSESIVQVGGGDPTSIASGTAAPSNGSGSAAAPSGRTTGGWTPRTRNGGDNPDAAVDNKISGAAKFLGVSPTDDISKLSPRKIAEAMTLSEGGAGSLADRNNNPGNIRNSDKSYKRFETKEAGLNAAAALVARKLRNGQTTVQTLIEGIPVKGGAPATPQAKFNGDGTKVLYTSKGNPNGAQGNAPSGYRFKSDGTLEAIPGGPADTQKLGQDAIDTMAEQYLSGDKSVMQGLGRGAQGSQTIAQVRAAIARKAKAAGMSGRDIAAQMADFSGVMASERSTGTRIAAIEIAATEAQKLAPLAVQASDALPRAGWVPFAKAEQAVRNGTNDVRLRRFVTANNGLVNTYARAVSPSGAPTVSDKEHARELLNTAMDQNSYRAVVQQMMKEIEQAKAAPRQVRNELRQNVGGNYRGGGAAMPRTATNPKTGQKMMLQGNRWVPMQ